jgi:hypothetical protein
MIDFNLDDLQEGREQEPERDLLRHSEWDFVWFMENPERDFTLWEGLAALEYELIREVFYLNAEYMHEIADKIWSADFAMDCIVRRVGMKIPSVPEHIIRSNFPGDMEAINFYLMHPYAISVEFPNITWFELSEEDRNRYTLSFLRMQTSDLPEERKITIDLNWSINYLTMFVREVLDRSSIERSRGGRGMGLFRDKLSLLGRYRLTQHFGDQAIAHRYWNQAREHSDPHPASLEAKIEEFELDELQTRYVEQMRAFVERSAFLERFIDPQTWENC